MQEEYQEDFDDDEDNEEEEKEYSPFPLIMIFTIQFFAWCGMFALWVDAYPVISSFLSKLHNSKLSSTSSALLVISLFYSYYATLSAILAFGLPKLVKKWGEGLVLGIGLIMSGLGIVGIGTSTSILYMFISFTALAIGWSTASNLPYSIVAGVVPEEEISHSMRVFSFSSIMPQIFVTIILFLLGSDILTSAAETFMIAGGVSMIFSGLLALLFKKHISPKAL